MGINQTENLKIINSIKENSVIDNLLTLAEIKEQSLADISDEWSENEEISFQKLLSIAIRASHNKEALRPLNHAIMKYNNFKVRYRYRHLPSVIQLEIRKIRDIKNALLWALTMGMYKINDASHQAKIQATQMHSIIKPRINIKRKKRFGKKSTPDSNEIQSELKNDR